MKQRILMIILFLGLFFLFKIDARALTQVCYSWDVTAGELYHEKNDDKVGLECGKTIKSESDFQTYCWVRVKVPGWGVFGEQYLDKYDIYKAENVCSAWDEIDETHDCSQYVKQQCNMDFECSWDDLTNRCYNYADTPSRRADNNPDVDNSGCFGLDAAACAKKDECEWDYAAERCYSPTAAGFTRDGDGNLVDPNQNTGNNPNGEGDVDLDQVDASCGGVLGSLAPDIKQALETIRIIGPIMAGIYTVIEYLKAVANKDAEAVTKANQRLIKRAILIVLLFFLPTLIDLLLMFIDSSYTTCVH